jgi:hypothetical protein
VYFVIAHWRGELSLTKSFLLNFMLGYIILVTLLVVTGELLQSHVGTETPARFHFYVGGIIFLVWFIWALVGVSRSSMKILRDGSSKLVRKGFAVLALVVIFAVFVISANDLRNLFF